MAVVGLAGQARAVDTLPASSGISLSPAIQDIVLAPAAQTAKFDVQLHNYSSQPVSFQLSSNDFTSLNQTGGIAFLGSNVAEATAKHGLSGLLTLSTPAITLAPGTTSTVTATIPDVRKLATGGHYAAILAKVVSPPDAAGTSNHVAINQVLSSLLFLQTAGQGTKTLKLLPPDIAGLSFHLPDNLNLVFAATGNTQTLPRGRVTISRGDTVVKQAIINENSSLILPSSSRLYATPLQTVGRSWLPGKYTVTVRYQYEGSLGDTVYQKTLLYINPITTGLLILIIALAVASLLFVRRRWSRLRQSPRAIRKILRFSRPVAVPLKSGKIVVQAGSEKPYTITIRREK